MPANVEQIKNGTLNFLRATYPNEASDLHGFLFGNGSYHGFIDSSLLSREAAQVVPTTVSDDLAASVTSDACMHSLYPLVVQLTGPSTEDNKAPRDIAQSLMNGVIPLRGEAPARRSDLPDTERTVITGVVLDKAVDVAREAIKEANPGPKGDAINLMLFGKPGLPGLLNGATYSVKAIAGQSITEEDVTTEVAVDATKAAANWALKGALTKLGVAGAAGIAGFVVGVGAGVFVYTSTAPPGLDRVTTAGSTTTTSTSPTAPTAPSRNSPSDRERPDRTDRPMREVPREREVPDRPTEKPTREREIPERPIRQG